MQVATTAPTANPNTENAEISSEINTEFEMVVHSDLSTVIVEDDESKTVVENLKLLDEIAAQISHKLNLRASTSSAALKKMKQQVNSVRTSAQLNSMISCFGRKAFGNSHRKIPVQPTAVSRRCTGLPRGIAPLGNGRPPKALPKSQRKRKRNLTTDIGINQPNATSH